MGWKFALRANFAIDYIEMGSFNITMTDEVLKSFMEMVVLIIEKSKDKEEALQDIKGLTILKGQGQEKE